VRFPVVCVYLLAGALCFCGPGLGGCASSRQRSIDPQDDGGLDGVVSALCGNGALDEGEACDDGNRMDGDGCGPSCTVEKGWACEGEPSVCESLCGNGILNQGEDCDGTDLGQNDCTTIGGGYTDGTLQCSPSCEFDTTGCVLPSCGNGEIDMGEECDDGNTANEDACLNNCHQNTCGDGYRNPAAEGCDDGNTSNLDGCLNNCEQNTCGDGYLNPATEQCDDGNTANNDACLSSCVPNTCGDGHQNPVTEQCDDGNTSNLDSCLADCTPNTCGDGFHNPAVEGCDDGNTSNLDGCLNICEQNTCGDGYKNPAAEQCDDGNTTSGDGCSASCNEEQLPVLHTITTLSGGWSESTITYAQDPHAPQSEIVGAASVTTRNQGYVFTASTYHLFDTNTLTWIDHGNLSPTFSEVSGPNITSGQGAKSNDGTESHVYIIEGEWYNLYHVDTNTGAVSHHTTGQIDWSAKTGPHPTPADVKTYWIALENDQGWVDASPELCGSEETEAVAYQGSITHGGTLTIYECSYCFDFIDQMPLGQFPPFSLFDAPAANDISAAFYLSPTLYVFTQP
jgi:cysteine-rich repeat protein